MSLLLNYLGFSWKAVNKVNYYIFTCLPFGLISACYIFTKVVRPLDTFWRSKGFLIVVYLDNGLGFEDSEESCFKVSKEVLSDLLSAGFLPNYEKSVWKPQISIDWLGFVWDLDKGILSIPERKILDILQLLNTFLENSKQLTAKKVAAVVGKVIALSPALGNIGQNNDQTSTSCYQRANLLGFFCSNR